MSAPMRTFAWCHRPCSAAHWPAALSRRARVANRLAIGADRDDAAGPVHVRRVRPAVFRRWFRLVLVPPPRAPTAARLARLPARLSRYAGRTADASATAPVGATPLSLG